MSFSENLQFFRARHTLTQEQLAERLDVSRQSVSKWESGQSYPEMDTLLTLCDLFGTDLDTLLRGSAEQSCAEDSAGYDRFMTAHARKIAGSAAGLILSFALCSGLYALNLPMALYTTLFWLTAGVCIVVLVASGIQYSIFCKRNPVITDFYTQKQRDAFTQRYIWHISGGVGGIIFSLAAACLGNYLLPASSPNQPHLEALIGTAFLVLLSGAVFSLIYGGMLQDKYDIEKYNRERAPEYQARQRKIAPFCGGVMLIATALFLYLGIARGQWNWCWLVYLPASAICAAIKVFSQKQP